MPHELHVIAGDDKGRVLRIDDDQPLVIGRSKDVAGHLNDPHVSRTHCDLHVESGELVLRDRGSTGGTFVNGQQITQHVLRPGDVIRVGETELRLPGDSPAKDDEPQLKPVSSIIEAGLGQQTPAALAASASVKKLTDLVGQTLAAYKLVHVLAAGRTGLVFHAHDTRHADSVALKVLKEEFSKDDEKMRRFVRAMKTMLPVRHPNLVSILNAGKSGAYCWIAMEYVEGRSLTQYIKERGFGGMIDWPVAFRVALHVGRALDFAHQRQIIHRAVTPTNILLEGDTGQAKLGDLMLAKALEG
ncbi:MAG TPA: serine/threonine-protein kinase, partial [Gemmataceae bacterium]|nr:serine/threonine-protein kinase [Gemmataceae bacterium]